MIKLGYNEHHQLINVNRPNIWKNDDNLENIKSICFDFENKQIKIGDTIYNFDQAGVLEQTIGPYPNQYHLIPLDEYIYYF